MSKIEEAAKAIHYTISGYKQSIGEPPYCLWNEVSAEIKQMLLNAVCLIQTKLDITPEEIHDYWCDFARQYMPYHPSLVPFKRRGSSLNHHRSQKEVLPCPSPRRRID